MRPQPITIHLGGEDWRVRPLTLAQIQRIEPLLSPEAQRSGASIAAATEIIMVALELDQAHAASRSAPRAIVRAVPSSASNSASGGISSSRSIIAATGPSFGMT